MTRAPIGKFWVLATTLAAVGCASQGDAGDTGSAGAASTGGKGPTAGGTSSSAGASSTTGGIGSAQGGTTSTLGGTSSSSGGTSAATGGTKATAGTTSTSGGAPSATGGTRATGGTAPTVGGTSAAGARATGGALSATGGTKATAGTSSTAGTTSATGGTTSGGGSGSNTGGTPSANGGSSPTGGTSSSTGGWPAELGGGPTAGNPEGSCTVPADAQPMDTSTPTHVIGSGTAETCTSDAVVSTVALGGIITFNCGPDPVAITLAETAKIFNDTGPEIVIDGGGKVTLSGGGERRILYMNTCDAAQHHTTSHCQDQDHPKLTLQNLTFVRGNSTNQLEEGGGGGAVFVRGGRVKVINSRFFNNVCDPVGQDLGGAGLRVLSQSGGLPVYVVGSTFGGAEGYGNECSNGGGISSIGVSWTVINSLFSYNRAIGNGGNPADPGTPGGGSGGAIYNDGNTMTLSLCGTRIEYNQVNAYGSAIFFVSNDKTGNVVIDQSTITHNTGGSWEPTYPQISNHPETPITVTNSTIVQD